VGFTTLTRGAIVWRGRDITRLTPHRRPRLGLGWVPQEREIFPSLSVGENLTVAARPGWGELTAVTTGGVVELDDDIVSGWGPRVVDYLRCYMDITARRPKVLYRGEALNPEAVIPRIGATYTYYGAAVVRQFEMAGIYSVNESQAISRSRDKLRSLQLLSRAGVGLPTTGFAHATQDIGGLLKVAGGPPVVVKLLEGTQGLGVVLAETTKAAAAGIAPPKPLPGWLTGLGGSAMRRLARSQRMSTRKLRDASAWTPRYGRASDAWPEIIADLGR